MRGLAADMAGKWQTMGIDGDHYKLAFRQTRHLEPEVQPGLGPDLDLKLFPPKVRQTELAFYLQHLNQFGPAPG